MALAPGAYVGGRFQIVRKIASGGMGDVWAGEQCATGMRVALKTLRPEVATDNEVVLRFKREAVLLGHVRSDRVARVIDFLFDPKCGPALVTEFVEGSSLAEGPVPVSLEQAVELGIEVAIAVRDLHRAHIVHRDLKPANVIMQPLVDTRTRAVLVDLGVSRLIALGEQEGSDELTAITKTHMVLGTVGFMAPEQIFGPREVTERADLYAVGAILFRMVSGHNVFDGLSQMGQLRAKLRDRAPRLETGRNDTFSRRFEVVVSRALEREPSDRYASADEMIAALSALRDEARRPAPAAGRTGSKSAPSRRHWVPKLVACAAMVVAAYGLAIAVPRAQGDVGQPRSAKRLPQTMHAAPSDEPPSSGDRSACVPADVFAAAEPTPPKDPPAVLLRRAREVTVASSQQARDAGLMRAMRSAVQEESVKTLTIRSWDDVRADWAHSAYRSPASSVVVAGAR